MMLYALLWRGIHILKCCYTFNFVYHFWSIITGTTTVTEVVLGSNWAIIQRTQITLSVEEKNLSLLKFVFFKYVFLLNTTPNKTLEWEIKWIQKPFFKKICMMTFPTEMCKHTFIVTGFSGIINCLTTVSVEWLIKFHQ